MQWPYWQRMLVTYVIADAVTALGVVVIPDRAAVFPRVLFFLMLSLPIAIVAHGFEARRQGRPFFSRRPPGSASELSALTYPSRSALLAECVVNWIGWSLGMVQFYGTFFWDASGARLISTLTAGIFYGIATTMMRIFLLRRRHRLHTAPAPPPY
jgi:hypothetical protein